uniref:Uncharacterized protein n=1 Tax=Eutreptiella gymnastica TaxID=73025 RepID=A0A7S1ILM2_9EUGL|mmetsp:Transcript_25919/g.46780  ORF Transcript_25919/g.46780 Transcript_25919/m.46780 type:complete len:184 (+) Transcript_25919:134-685(+)
MAPKKQSAKALAKAAKQAEAEARALEICIKQQQKLFAEEDASRQHLQLIQRQTAADAKLEKNRQFAQFLVEKKTHLVLQEKFNDLSTTWTADKAALEKAVSTMSRTKENLETELVELTQAHKLQSEELFVQRKKLEHEMSERGNCFVCPDCSKQIYGTIRKTGLAATLLRREAKNQHFDLPKA